jgi:hypothetical protein
MPENDERRTTKIKVVAAVITGVTAGTARAITTWLLDHLSTHN